MVVHNRAHICRVQGFTLLEVVLVLLIFGILASIAIPKFVDLQRDARLGSMQAVKGALYSTTGIYRPLAAIRGVKTGNLLVNGKNVKFHCGFNEKAP
jgi:MSHA pilin protein MshA